MNSASFLACLLAAGAIGLATGYLAGGCGRPVPELIRAAWAAAGLALSVLSRPRGGPPRATAARSRAMLARADL